MSIRSSARNISARKKAFDRAVKGVLWYVGWLGMALLIGCGALWLLPLAEKPERLPIYTMIAMVMASFVGWLYVNHGQDRVKKHLGHAVNVTLFFALPMTCLIAGLAQNWIIDTTGWQPPGHPFWLFVRWYPIALVLVCGCVFMASKTKPRKHVYLDRGLGYALLFLPYALLFAYLALGVHMDWIDGSMHDTLESTGRYSIAIQLILAFFIGGD